MIFIRLSHFFTKSSSRAIFANEVYPRIHLSRTKPSPISMPLLRNYRKSRQRRPKRGFVDLGRDGTSHCVNLRTFKCKQSGLPGRLIALFKSDAIRSERDSPRTRPLYRSHGLDKTRHFNKCRAEHQRNQWVVHGRRAERAGLCVKHPGSSPTFTFDSSKT